MLFIKITRWSISLLHQIIVTLRLHRQCIKILIIPFVQGLNLLSIYSFMIKLFFWWFMIYILRLTIFNFRNPVLVYFLSLITLVSTTDVALLYAFDDLHILRFLIFHRKVRECWHFQMLLVLSCLIKLFIIYNIWKILNLFIF